MTLESFPNELLLELLEFLDAAELFRAFHGLNGRFNALLSTQFRTYRLNFHWLLKYQSDFPLLHYLPFIVHQISSLRLSDNNNEGLPEIDCFFSSGLLINQFISLQSLSLCYIDNQETLRKIIVDCHQLLYFTHLKVVKCHTQYMSSVDFSNMVWSLSTLTHCRLDMQDNFCVPTVTSLSMEYLSISCQRWYLTQTTSLCQQTPYLQRLHVPLNNMSDNLQMLPSPFPLVTMLKLSNVRSLKALKAILLAVPNLIQLKIDMYYIDCDGYLFEEIIAGHLPKLEAFRLRMQIQFGGEKNNGKHVDGLVDSFRTSFWLEQHRWFIHCHHALNSDCRSVLLYTLPYGFDDFNLNIFTATYKSTCPQDTDHYLYDRVVNLRYDSSLYKDGLFVQLFNIRSLSIHLPFNKHFEDIVPTLHRLDSLTVLSAKENAQFYLQSLLDRAPCLHSLTIQSWPLLQIPAVENTSASVRRLNLRVDGRASINSFFSRVECNTFIRSSLGIQCEELFIKVENHDIILALLNNMNNLRILHIECQLDSTSSSVYNHYERESVVRIKWLRDQLPVTSTIFKSSCIFNSLKLSICLKKP